MRLTLYILIVLSCLMRSTKSARILGIYPMPWKSHFSHSQSVMMALHAAGHDVTMISPFPAEEKIKNFTYADSRFDSPIFVNQSSIEYHDDHNSLSWNSMMKMMEMATTMVIEFCQNIMKVPEMQEALTSSEKLYDIIFVEIIMGHECVLPVAEKLGTPVIGTVALHNWYIADIIAGAPTNPMVIPSAFQASSEPEMSFVERIKNLFMYIVIDYAYKSLIHTAVEKFNREYFDKNLLYKKDISMIFYNNHASILPRAIPPNIVEIGGIHVKQAKPLPQDFQKFIDEASHGVILFTFGSALRGDSLPLEKRRAFLETFSSIPQKIIWKFEEPIDELPENIRLASWLPQRDILEHKNVIAFISHCGISGVYEAIMTATPVVTVPLSGDQFQNAAHLLHQGVAVNLELKAVTKETVLRALNTIINDTSFYKRMETLSKTFKDRPMTPQQSIVYWTEYVIKNNETPYLKPLGMEIPLYKYFMLDIVALVIAMISFGIYVICCIKKFSTI